VGSVHLGARQARLSLLLGQRCCRLQTVAVPTATYR
jgi:hypothetical protein